MKKYKTPEKILSARTGATTNSLLARNTSRKCEEFYDIKKIENILLTKKTK